MGQEGTLPTVAIEGPAARALAEALVMLFDAIAESLRWTR